jgi:hypothetical protein
MEIRFTIEPCYRIKVNSMKQMTLTVTLLLSLANAPSALAEEQVVQIEPVEAISAEVTTITTPDTPVSTASEQTKETTAPDSATASSPGDTGKPCPMKGAGKMSKGKDGPCKGKGGKRKDGCRHDKHQQVVERLDLIDARLAKIEAMLESLLRR